MDFIDQYLDGVCRTCLIEVEESSFGNNTRTQWQTILDRVDECSALRIAELLSTAVPQIQIQPRDELPKKICYDCLQQLLSAYRFQQMCLRSEEQMRELISAKHTDSNISIIEVLKEHELEASDTDLTALETADSSSTQQPSIQKPLYEIAERMAEDDAVQSSPLENINKAQEACNDEEACFNEFIKNEPIEKDDTIHSTNSIECKEEETNRSRDEIIAPKEDQVIAAYPLESFDQLPEHSNDTQGEFSEFFIIEHIKEEDDTVPLTIPIECEEEINVCKDVLIEPETTQSSAANQLEGMDQLPEHCKDSQAELTPFIKNEPIEDDEPSIEYSDDDIIHSTIPYESLAKEEVLAIELEEQQQVNTKFSQRPYTCAECGKTFSTSSILANHRKIHVEDKAYECTYCPLRFTTNAAKLSHEKMHEEAKGATVLSHKNEDPQTRERNIEALREGEAELKQLISKDKTQQASAEILQELKTNAAHCKNRPFECPYCPLRFYTISNLHQHKQIHEGVKQVACDICGKNMRKQDLKKHKLIHSKERLHKCDLCEKRFLDRSRLQVHMRTHTGERPFKCQYCECAYTTSTALMKHLRNHLGDNVFRCQFCPLAFPSSTERRLHLFSHKNEDPEIRERNIKALEEVEAKLRLQISKDKTQQPSTEEPDQQLKTNAAHCKNRPFECPYCPLRFYTISNLYQHKQIHEGVKRVACDIRGKKMRKENLHRHKLLAHSKEKLPTCECCGRRFITIQNLVLHTSKHNCEKPYKCRYCESAYYSLTGLNKHLRIHLGDNVYRCELCPLTFPSASERSLHLLSHKNEDPDTPEPNIKALQEEGAKLRLHISEQPLEMQVKEKEEDKQHKLQITYEYPYKCNICNERFKSIEYLRLHMRIHTEEYPFKCIYCEFAYTSNKGLVKHLRIHLGDNVFRCELCPLTFPSASERHLHFDTHKNEDSETRERNIKALREKEAKLMLNISKKTAQLPSISESEEHLELKATV